ncbi:MAG: hypothetical protein IJJ84_07845, partial [Kiritimatiellae bacterium]|nr:hypothetical protein [Kiritimatiellia bacterium]
MKKIACLMCAMAFSFAAHAATRTWNPTVKASDGKYYWSNADNWLDDNGNTGVPQTEDTVVLTNNTSVWGISG